MPNYVNLTPGDPAPWFHQRSFSRPKFVFDTVGGRYIVLCFFASAADPQGRAALAVVAGRRQELDDEKACFFGVSNDAADEAQDRIADSLPGIRFFLDYDGTISRLYGATPVDAIAGGQVPVRQMWVVLDPTLRVLKAVPFRSDGGDAAEVLDFVAALPAPSSFPGFEIHAPVLVLPNVFEPEFCATLIGLYETNGGTETGFMREVNGKTVAVQDYGHKRRKDYTIKDPEIIRQTQMRIQRRIVPEIQKVHQFKVTRMERYIVSCYSADDGGHFRPHRDNTTKGTAHRRFAVSINLNADFEGGRVGFPEYGPRGFKAPPGGAVVFSCSLLHAVSEVTKGARFAFLPFLYDDEAAKIRAANNQFLADNVDAYKTG